MAGEGSPMTDEEAASLLEFLSPDDGRARRLSLLDQALKSGRPLRRDWASRLGLVSWVAKYERDQEVASRGVSDALLEPPGG